MRLKGLMQHQPVVKRKSHTRYIVTEAANTRDKDNILKTSKTGN